MKEGLEMSWSIGKSAVVACMSAALLASCAAGQSQFVPSSTGTSNPQSIKKSRFVYVADRANQELLVYPAHQSNPKPIRMLGAAAGIVDVGGVAVDKYGDVYVANGRGGNVLEFTSGASSFVKAFSAQLTHPVNVAVDKSDTVYVVNQEAHYQSGATSAIVEFPRGDEQPGPILYDPSNTNRPLRGIAVNDSGNVFTSTSQSHDVWPPPKTSCYLPPDNQIYDFIFPTLIMPITLSVNTQVWGLTLDKAQDVYASDYCDGSVEVYLPTSWNHTGTVPYKFDMPVYQTMSADQLLVVPCGGGKANGYVAVRDLANGKQEVIWTGLRAPIGGAAGP
jgi:hypothetical protein